MRRFAIQLTSFDGFTFEGRDDFTELSEAELWAAEEQEARGPHYTVTVWEVAGVTDYGDLLLVPPTKE